MPSRKRGAATPAPAPEPSPSQLSPRERIAQIRAERERAAPPPAAGRVLTLATLDPEERTIAVDDVDYRLRFYDELPLAGHAVLLRKERDMTRGLDALIGDGLPDLDDDGLLERADTLNDTLNEVLRTVVPSLPERFLVGVPAKTDEAGDEIAPEIPPLKFDQRWDIWTAFRTAQAERTVRLARARAARQGQPTGDRSSTPSPSPTAPPRATGRTRPRSATSSTPITA